MHTRMMKSIELVSVLPLFTRKGRLTVSMFWIAPPPWAGSLEVALSHEPQLFAFAAQWLVRRKASESSALTSTDSIGIVEPNACCFSKSTKYLYPAV